MSTVAARVAKFGQEVRRMREEIGLTQGQLAVRSGLSPIYIGTIENGRRDPSLSTVYGLAKGLGLRTGELFGRLPALSATAQQVVMIFDKAPADVQRALLYLLHAISRDIEDERPASRRKERRTA
jgi:transcriptional regulator with XRE-family HTH domain